MKKMIFTAQDNQYPNLSNSVSPIRALAKGLGSARGHSFICMMLILVTLSGRMYAQPETTQFVPFRDFIQKVETANSAHFVGQPGNRVRNQAAFEQMRQHILEMYQGVEVSHSFVLSSRYFDCVPINQQPSVRLLGLKSIAQPPPEAMLTDRRATVVPPYPQLDKPNFDEFGNSVRCEEGTVPILRITLERMSRFEDLDRFFEKGPGGAGQAHVGVSQPLTYSDEIHQWAHASQWVNNLGGSSALNLYKPYIRYDRPVNWPHSEIFSLSQHWYVGGSPLQTVEVGWQNSYALYGTPCSGDECSVLFIFYTSDGYKDHKCYNTDCGAFVLATNDSPLARPFPHYSDKGGAQYDFTAEYYLHQGNWWLAIDGKWIGYYPTVLFGGGQMSKYAQVIDYGGEVCVDWWWHDCWYCPNGDDTWPGMGSGEWPDRGYGWAAYQRKVLYIDTNSRLRLPSLTKDESKPDYYKVAGPYFTNKSDWGVYFYFGGPSRD